MPAVHAVLYGAAVHAVLCGAAVHAVLCGAMGGAAVRWDAGSIAWQTMPNATSLKANSMP